MSAINRHYFGTTNGLSGDYEAQLSVPFHGDGDKLMNFVHDISNGEEDVYYYITTPDERVADLNLNLSDFRLMEKRRLTVPAGYNNLAISTYFQSGKYLDGHPYFVQRPSNREAYYHVTEGSTKMWLAMDSEDNKSSFTYTYPISEVESEIKVPNHKPVYATGTANELTFTGNPDIVQLTWSSFETIGEETKRLSITQTYEANDDILILEPNIPQTLLEAHPELVSLSENLKNSSASTLDYININSFNDYLDYFEEGIFRNEYFMFEQTGGYSIHRVYPSVDGGIVQRELNQYHELNSESKTRVLLNPE